MDIYQLAVQYLIPRLEHVSIQYLELKISKTNVLDALYYADKMKYAMAIGHSPNWAINKSQFNLLRVLSGNQI